MPNLTISNIHIPVDIQNRINLNALHRASGTPDNKRPSQWLRTATTKELIAELDQSANMHFASIHAQQGGKNQGTFAHELLAISYAGWISPKFQLQVNQAFLDAKRTAQPPAKVVKTPVFVESLDHDKIAIDKDKYIHLLESHIAMTEHRLNTQPKRRNYSEEEKLRIFNMRANGRTPTDIAKSMGRSLSSIRTVLRNMNKEGL